MATKGDRILAMGHKHTALAVSLVFSLILCQPSAFGGVEGEPDSHQEVEEGRPTAPTYAPGQIIVKVKEGYDLSAIEPLNQRFGVSSVTEVFPKEPTAQERLQELKKKRAGLEGQEHPSWYWWKDKDSPESKEYQTRIEKEKAELDSRIKGQEGLIARLERRQKRAPKDAVVPSLDGTYLLKVDESTDIPSMVRTYQDDPAVEYAQPDYIMKIQAFPDTLPNDTYVDPDQDGVWSTGAWGQEYGDLWGLKKIKADEAWKISQGEGIVVAVVDTGLDYNHPDIWKNVWVDPGIVPDRNGDGVVDLDDVDLNGNRQVEWNEIGDHMFGWDVIYGDKDPMDLNGHGTHVAGTIAAVANNGIGVVGVAPRAKVMPVKVLDDRGISTSSVLAQGIRYPVNHGVADVINNSWGCMGRCPENPLVMEAIRLAYANGLVLVFAGGNSRDDVAAFSPQNASEVISVASLDHLDQRSSFSNLGAEIDVAAPGGESGGGCSEVTPSILSLRAMGTDIYRESCGPAFAGRMVVGGSYYRARGTSMAAPHVAGVCALVLSRHPEFSNEEVRRVLQISADDVGTPGFDWETGFGRVNAARALTIDSVPQVYLTSPQDKAILSRRDRSVMVTGTAAGPGFQQYELLYQTDIPVGPWRSMGGPVFTPVVDGVLGNWLIGDLPDGPSLVLLSVTTSSGQRFQEVAQYYLEWVTPRRLTDGPQQKWGPSISGDRIVWGEETTGDRDPTSNHLYLYDLPTDTKRSISSDLTWLSPPTIWRDWIVWLGQQSRIHLFNLNTKQERIVNQGGIAGNLPFDSPPVMSGHWLVYVTVDHILEVYDLTTFRERLQKPVFEDPGFANPRPQVGVSGDRIVYSHAEGGNVDVYLYDLSTDTERRITDHPSDQVRPVIWGDWIIYEDHREQDALDPDPADLFLYDLRTGRERQLTSHPATQIRPDVAGNQVVWEDFWGQFRIPPLTFLQDLTTGETHRVISSLFEINAAPSLSGNRVAWIGVSSRMTLTGQVYVSEFGPSSRSPVLEPIGSRTARVGETLQFPISATDPDGDPLVLATRPSPLPRGASLETVRSEPGTLTKILRWMPGADQVGTNTFFFRVMDPSDFSDTEEVTVTVTAQPSFIRGDANGDGRVDISDVVTILLYLYRGQKVPSLDPCDVDDNGWIDVTDALRLVSHLFKGGPPPVPPYPNPGADPTPDGLG